MEIALLLALFLFACSGGDGAKTDDTGAVDTDTSADTDTSDTSGGDSDTSGGDSDTAPACAAVNPGDDWAWTGECPGMTTPVAITVDACRLTLDYDAFGGMTMGMPYTATIVGDVVTFENDNTVNGCEGTIQTADKIEGTCNRGCTYTLRR